MKEKLSMALSLILSDKRLTTMAFIAITLDMLIFKTLF